MSFFSNHRVVTKKLFNIIINYIILIFKTCDAFRIFHIKKVNNVQTDLSGAI